jgi:hypothetical protein
MTQSENGGNMRRALFVALGLGLVVTGAAALDIGAARLPAARPSGADPYTHAARERASARDAQREQIQGRYLVEREKCAALGGFQRDQCLVRAHAAKGRALLESAAPYEVRL